MIPLSLITADAGPRTPFDRSGDAIPPDPERRAGDVAMWLTIAALGLLFFPLVFAYFVVRNSMESWPDSALPPMPAAVWVSTALLIGVSGGLEVMVRAAKRNRDRLLSITALIVLLLGSAFVANQLRVWMALFDSMPVSIWQITGLFYFFMGMHALHVIAGVVPLVIVMANALRGVHATARHKGVRWCAMYWHFLGAVWLVIVGLLLITL